MTAWRISLPRIRISGLTSWIKQKTLVFSRLFGPWLVLRRTVAVTNSTAGKILISIAGVVLGGILSFSISQKGLVVTEYLTEIFIGAGALIGTMVALVVSLSIIPVQRAAEVFTPSIIRHFRQDRTTQFIFVTLAVLCLFSFALPTATGILDGRALLFIQIVIIAVTLDLLRWYHRHTVRLLEPQEPVNRLVRTIKKYIDQIQRTVSRLARLQWHTLTDEQKRDNSPDDLESALYLKVFSRHSDYINALTSELAEIALKAVARGETQTAEFVVFGLAEIACYYIGKRKDNLILTLAPQAMVEESDIHNLLVPLYEHLKDINRGAISLRNERVCICVARALGNIASEMVKLKSRAFRGHGSPLACMPLGYLKVCAESAQNEGLSDAALQGSEALVQVALCAPPNIAPGDVHLPIIEGLYRFATNFLVSGKWQLVNKPLDSMMRMAHHLLEQKHFQLTLILKDMLQKLELLAPLAVSYEKKFPVPLPLGFHFIQSMT
ncbi:DUF2254 family protein [Thermodesulfitimonas sp.]